MMLEVKDLTVTTGTDRVLLNKVSFSLKAGDKLAIIGEEGNGKSTLIKAIADPADITYAEVSGTINTSGSSIGYLRQSLGNEWLEETAHMYFLKDKPKSEPDFDRYENFDKITAAAGRFKLDPEILISDRLISELSGGEKVKLQLIKVTLMNPDILILDEPTNDLDIDTLDWLEDYINNCGKLVIFVSHDEMLLERTANCILHLEQIKRKTSSVYNYERVSYSEYVENRAGRIEKQTQVAHKEREQDRKQSERWNDLYNKVRHELNAVSRQDPGTGRLLKKKMKTVKAQEKRFEREREDFTEIPDVEEAVDVYFEDVKISAGKVILDKSIDILRAGDKVLAENIRLAVRGGEKLCITGTNGSGKTVLLKLIVKELSERIDISLGYLPQNYEDELGAYLTVPDFIAASTDNAEDALFFRTLLGRLKFTPEEMGLDIASLSSGQKVKLCLAKLIVRRPNVLVLDEPTRNLSPLTNPVMRRILSDFGGTVICVTHDRKLIESLEGRNLRLTREGLVLL